MYNLNLNFNKIYAASSDGAEEEGGEVEAWQWKKRRQVVAKIWPKLYANDAAASQSGKTQPLNLPVKFP